MIQNARIRILRVKSLRYREHSERIFTRHCKDRYAVEGTAGRYDAAAAESADAGFKPHNVVKRGRYSAGSGRVGTQCKAREPGGHGNRRSGAGATGNIPGVEAIEASAIR